MRHGCYWRAVIVERETILIPVMRYLCRRKGKAETGAHRTFSLLPVQSHPYKRYSSEGSYSIFKESLLLTLTATLDRFAESFENLCISTIYRIRRVFEAAGTRLRMFEYLEASKETLFEQVVVLTDRWPGQLLSLKTDFYQRQGMFLLGTSSQNR